MKTKSTSNIPLPERAKEGNSRKSFWFSRAVLQDGALTHFGNPESVSGIIGMPKIQIKLEHGIVQAIDGLTPEVAIEVYDYDVEKYDDQKLSTDEHGQACEIKEWHAPE